MLKVNRKTLLITSAVILLPILAGVALWDRLPDPMATHFGPSGEADGFSSKALAVFGLPAFMLAIHLLAVLVTTHDPKKQNISRKLFGLVLWIVPAVSVFANAAVYMFNLGYKADVTFFVELLLGLMFIIIGNFLPKARQNYSVGIRLPWTLADEENWNRTHRLAGHLWVAGGMIILIAALTGFFGFWIIMATILAISIIPCVYSFMLHAKKGL